MSHRSTVRNSAHIGCWGFRCRFWLALWVFGLVFVSCFSFFSPYNMQSFHPSHDDLGTPPTRRPRSWKKTLQKLIWLPSTKETEQGGTAATDLGLAAEQVAMHAIYSYQIAAQEAITQGTVQPSMQVYSDLPREWPMARLCISYKQVNRYIRTALWRRVAERGCKVPTSGASRTKCIKTS